MQSSNETDQQQSVIKSADMFYLAVSCIKSYFTNNIFLIKISYWDVTAAHMNWSYDESRIETRGSLETRLSESSQQGKLFRRQQERDS